MRDKNMDDKNMDKKTGEHMMKDMPMHKKDTKCEDMSKKMDDMMKQK